jgi:formylglycine-generating enzyme required for sulfatase activity
MPHIFLSYSRKDASLMARMRTDLRAEGLEVWTDEGIKPGTPSWKRAIEDAIRNAGCLICILSPDAAQSRWVREELDFAEARGKQIFLVMARGNEDDAVPFGFSTHQWVDIRDSYEPFNNQLIPAICEYLQADCASQLPERGLHDAEDKPRLEFVEREHTSETPGLDEVSDLGAQPGAERAVVPESVLRRLSLNRVILAFALTIFSVVVVWLISAIVTPMRPVPSPTPALTLTMDTVRPTLASTPFTPTISRTPETSNSEWTPISQRFNGVEMVFVPAGCFMMGSENGSSDEQPVHEQCIEEPFWIDRYEVTNAQFEQFGGAAGRESYWSDPQRPREQITWREARAFCEEKRGARLPTEAEWEYAARGPDSLTYPWGDLFAMDEVVYFASQTADVGEAHRPEGQSWVGVYDMTGNVWEWVSTAYDNNSRTGEFPYPYDLDDGREDLERTDVLRTLRGGGFNVNRFTALRSAIRLWESGEDEGNNKGFRCALSE